MILLAHSPGLGSQLGVRDAAIGLEFYGLGLL